ncbi:LytTR family DNA-binding domain-containing protein [Flavobacterium foetidum]|uniref:LytTR family DNA-binding domain-containing protein n=1 Tax=Flavobacterium foetidum TaxID=2026681 RepID=UPI0010753F10|nr:LytTR family DNA-binding domain-containing protein [Flavobacterium foetidum]KAF2517108.1 LytTR family transcriptional regulator [Flavobacterium foetidum]
MLLNTLYPNSETNKEIILTSSLTGMLLYFLLIIYQPFGTSQFEHSYKYLLLFPYGIITTFSFCSINLLLSKQNIKWTIGSELFKTFWILLLISSLSYFYNTLFVSKVSFSFENYLYMFAYTTALGGPVVMAYILARYIYLNNKENHLMNKNVSFGKTVLEHDTYSKTNEKNTKLFITADYSNYCLELQESDFLFAESADNYCMLYFYKNGMLQKEMIRISLTKLLSQIQTDTIKQIHRSFIVNLEKTTRFKGNSSGYKIAIQDIEKELTVSRKYLDSAVPILKNFVLRP